MTEALNRAFEVCPLKASVKVRDETIPQRGKASEVLR